MKKIFPLLNFKKNFKKCFKYFLNIKVLILQKLIIYRKKFVTGNSQFFQIFLFFENLVKI